MKIFRDISLCKDVKNPVLTLGVFDGVHVGHQSIIEKLNNIAEECGGESTLLTFEPHPRLVLNKEAELQLLTTLEEKISLLEKYGLKNLILHPFTPEFANLSSEDFVRKLLVDEIGIHTIVIGYDHQFGKNRTGNFELLEQLSGECSFELERLEEVKRDDFHVSSTHIRKALLEGDLENAHKGLGRKYSLSGKVVHGDKIGRTLGFPTANLSVDPHKLIPANGVYVVRVKIRNQNYKGLLSIGTRPTITHSNEKRVEVFILDFHQEIYGEILQLEFEHFIRKDLKFNTIDDLVQQMNLDLEFANEFKIDYI